MLIRISQARGDSPESLSKSCSDKLALRQCTSILASHTSLLIAPGNAYLTSIIIPESQFVPAAIIRCFSREGRMKAIDDSSWGTGYSFRPFKILTTSKEFSYSKRRIPSPASLPRPSNLATVWNPHGEEVSINGILQGRKQTDINCASMLSRVRLVAMVRGILGNKLSDTVSTYTEFKQCHPQLIQRADVKNQVIKQALTAWIRNSPDCFELRTPPLPSRRTSVRVPGALDTGIRQHCYIQGLTAVAKLGRLK